VEAVIPDGSPPVRARRRVFVPWSGGGGGGKLGSERSLDMVDSYILFDLPPGQEPVDPQFLEQLGHRVMVCNGPQGGTCPILSGEGCELAENAHGVVFELDLDDPQHRSILAKYKAALKDDVPIRVMVLPGQAAKYPELLSGLKVLTHIPVAGDLDSLAAEVDAADL
jgi:hypothetical protein